MNTNTFYTINGLYKLMEKALKRNDYDRVDAIEKVMDVLIWIERQNNQSRILYPEKLSFKSEEDHTTPVRMAIIKKIRNNIC